MIELHNTPPDIAAMMRPIRLPIATHAAPDRQAMRIALEDVFGVEALRAGWGRRVASKDGLVVQVRDSLTSCCVCARLPWSRAIRIRTLWAGLVGLVVLLLTGEELLCGRERIFDELRACARDRGVKVSFRNVAGIAEDDGDGP